MRFARKVLLLHLLLSWGLPAFYPLPQALAAEDDAQAADSRSQAEELALKRLEKSKELTPYQVSDWESRIRSWEKARLPASIFQKGWRGLRPLVGGMPSGSGWVYGAGYVVESEGELVRAEINGRYSTLGYTQLDGRVDMPIPQSTLPFRYYAFAKQYNYTALNCFGLGPDSSEEKRFFRQEGHEVKTGVSYEVDSSLELAGSAGIMRAEAMRSEKGSPVDEMFLGLPGLGDGKTTFTTWEARVRIKSFDTWDFPYVGWDLTLDAHRYDDRTSKQYTSNRFVVELRGQVPIINRNRRLAFRFRTAHMIPDSGQEVPFYLLETLGGARSLRGFHEYRFRDLRNLVLNLEYRWELWPYTDFALFVDGGKVFPDFDDFNLKKLQWGYGGGIRIRGPGGLALNIDLAGSREGVKLHIGSGVLFR